MFLVFFKRYGELGYFIHMCWKMGFFKKKFFLFPLFTLNQVLVSLKVSWRCCFLFSCFPPNLQSFMYWRFLRFCGFSHKQWNLGRDGWDRLTGTLTKRAGMVCHILRTKVFVWETELFPSLWLYLIFALKSLHTEKCRMPKTICCL